MPKFSDLTKEEKARLLGRKRKWISHALLCDP
jgi:hypothetical protein